MVDCRECGEPLEAGWGVCPACEAPIDAECPQCGRQTKAHWKRCPGCKSVLNGGLSGASNATGYSTEIPPPPSSPYLTEVAQPGTWSGSGGSRGWSGTPESAASPGSRPPGPAMPELEPGTVLEQYEIEAVLGRGGYGVVYRARHRTLGDAFAVKAMGAFGASEALVEALAGEYRAQKRIKDKRYILESEAPVVTVHGNVDWVLLPMEIAEKSLREWLDQMDREEGGWLEEGLELLGQVCEGVGAIHEAGLVHLDLKPENLLLVEEGTGEKATWVAKVADFGLTRGLAELEQTRPELFGDGVGTPAYMAPEQVMAAHWADVGPAADIYALGMLLYELLQGRLPYSGSAERIKAKKRDRELQIGRPEGPARLVELAMRCLSREESERPASAAEVARLLKEDPEERAVWDAAKEADGAEIHAGYLEADPGGAWTKEASKRRGELSTEREKAGLERRESADGARSETERKAREEGMLRPVVNGVQFGFERIPAGEFLMGSEDRLSETPVHLVKISREFLMQVTPVTWEQWEAVMGRHYGEPCRPVHSVSWEDARVFIGKLNRMVSGGGFRLPTEAEWEYACRAGTTGDYGGTGRLEDMGWYRDNSGGKPQPVGQKLPNAWGLYDMHGNVWEWCEDWHDDNYYSVSPEVDPMGPARGERKVLRGGAYLGVPADARSAKRGDHLSRMVKDFHIGFRLARTM